MPRWRGLKGAFHWRGSRHTDRCRANAPLEGTESGDHGAGCCGHSEVVGPMPRWRGLKGFIDGPERQAGEVVGPMPRWRGLKDTSVHCDIPTQIGCRANAPLEGTES